MPVLGKSVMDAIMSVYLMRFCVEATKLHLNISALSEDSLVKNCRSVKTKIIWYVYKASKPLNDDKQLSLLFVASSSASM